MKVLRQGKSNIDGNEVELLITQTTLKDGREIVDTYMKVGPFFPNKYKQEGDKKPDYTCNIMVDGETKRLAGWKSETKRGMPYISLKYSDPQEGSGASTQRAAPQQQAAEQAPKLDDDIPF